MKPRSVLFATLASVVILAAPARAEVDDGLKHYNGPAYAALARHLAPQAAAGNAAAQLTLAVMFETGWGVPRDMNTALRFYQMAAQQGSTEARLALGSAATTASPHARQ